MTTPTVSVTYDATGATHRTNELGMRPMQERAFERRGEQYLLIKSPPASGKSRALMFVALDKLHRQGLEQAIVVVPERSIGASFRDAALTAHGFWADWRVKPEWNLCDAPGGEDGKVGAVGRFLASGDDALVCTHATFRFAVERFGAAVFDDRLIAVDEFHHVSANPDNVLGRQLGEIIARGSAHIIAMTGSYFRGDAEAVLTPEDEERFAKVVYTYYEQLNGYRWLKHLDIGYVFYTDSYADSILSVLDADRKTIVHIPSVNSRESTKDKHREVEHILDALGDWKGADPDTGFQLVERADGRVLRIADLVDDQDAARRGRVLASLKDERANAERDHVDIIIALGMAKEGFDWVWCEHALTVGYRASLTEVVQIIGRATRDAEGKTHARFTNLIAEPDASDELVAEAVNDTLKAIAASLLMEQVLTPRFEFVPKRTGTAPDGAGATPDGAASGAGDLGEPGQQPYQIEIKGLVEPKSDEAKRVCREDLEEVVTAFVQDRDAVARGMFDEETITEELTQVRMGKIVRDKYPDMAEEDVEAVRQRAVAALNIVQKAKEDVRSIAEETGEPAPNTAFLDGVRRYAMDVRDLDMDLIDAINPFGEAYAVMAKTMNEARLREIAAVIAARKSKMTFGEARDYARRALAFTRDRGREPQPNASDPWEAKLAEGALAFRRLMTERAAATVDA